MLRSRLTEIKDKLPDRDHLTKHLAIQTVSLVACISDTKEQDKQAHGEIQDLRELLKNLTTENTLLCGRLRTLEAQLSQVHHFPAQVPPFPDPSTRHDQAPSVLASSERQERREQVPQAPKFEEFMSGTRAPHQVPVFQAQANQVAAPNPLKTVAAQAPLVITCDGTSVPPPYQAVPQVLEPIQEGPCCPSLAPHVPMLISFKLLVSYRHYRLKNTRAVLQDWESELLYKIKRCFDSFYLTFQVFEGFKPIKLFGFLTILRGRV